MRFVLKIFLSAVAVLILAKILPGTSVDNYISALIVAVVLTFLNTIVKPLLVLLTLPVTIITLGLFLLVINAAIIQLASYFVDGFRVENWLWALVFSVLLSLFQYILYTFIKKNK